MMTLPGSGKAFPSPQEGDCPAGGQLFGAGFRGHEKLNSSSQRSIDWGWLAVRLLPS